MKTVTIEIRDIDYKDIAEKAEKRGMDIANYIMARYYLDVDEDDRIRSVEILIEDMLFNCGSIEEIYEKSQHINEYALNIGADAVYMFEEEEE